MLTLFRPRFSGTHRVGQVSHDLIPTLSNRLSTVGLLPLAPPRRNRYRVVRVARNGLHFRSTSLLTAINVGLNDVRLTVDPAQGAIRYEVSYWTWAKYAIALSFGICLAIAAFMLPPAFGVSLLPAQYYGASSQAMLWIGVPMLVFWGLVWPWILIAIHKRQAAKLLLRILDEVNALSLKSA